MKFSQIYTPSAPAQTREIPRAALTPKRVKPREIYAMAIREARILISGLSAKPVRLPDVESACEVVESVIGALETSPSEILSFIERSTPEDYLTAHLANVMILSLALAQKMKLSKEARRALGVGALIHEAGEIFSRPAAAPQSGPPSQECMLILQGFLHSLNDESRTIITKVLLQSHQRLNIKNPSDSSQSEISAEAQIIGLCHDYESMSHPRPNRARKLSHDVLRTLIEQAGEAFDGNLLKMLWETLTLFPPGSYVRLSTGEIARIVTIFPDRPMKPSVQIVAGPAGERIKEEKFLDLGSANGIVVESAIDECAAPLQDPSLHLELKAQRWWMD